MSIFGLFEVFLFIAQKDVFSFQNIVKHIFLCLNCLKQKVGKMTIIGPKPWVHPFARISIFGVFELLVFIAQKGVFSFQNIVKYIFEEPITRAPGNRLLIFLAYIAKGKKLVKMAIFGPKPWVNPLQERQFLDFLNFLFLQPRKAFSRFRIS